MGRSGMPQLAGRGPPSAALPPCRPRRRTGENTPGDGVPLHDMPATTHLAAHDEVGGHGAQHEHAPGDQEHDQHMGQEGHGKSLRPRRHGRIATFAGPGRRRWPRKGARMADEVLRERRGHVEILTINRPEARNAINGAVSRAMTSAMDELADDADCWVVILTGSGDKAFCAGMDLKAFSSGEGKDIMGASGGFGGLTERDFDKPLIAAVNGSALAGGLEIMLSCDLVVAADHAKFGIPEAKRGLIAGAGGLLRLPKRLPLAVAYELAMTGDPMDAARALRVGAGQPGRAGRFGAHRGARPRRPDRRQRTVGRPLLQERDEARRAKCPNRKAGRSTRKQSTWSSTRPTPWKGPSPSPRSGSPAGRVNSPRRELTRHARLRPRHPPADPSRPGGGDLGRRADRPRRPRRTIPRLRPGRARGRSPGRSPAWPGRPTPCWSSPDSGMSPPSTGPTRATPGRRS